MIDLWRQLAAAAQIPLNEESIVKLGRYLDLLTEANQRMNLTRITDRAQAELHHVADALTMLAHVPPGAQAMVDVGTGGGVPGIPLAIVLPQLRVVLVESTQKKAHFLRQAAAELMLNNVTVEAIRAEEAGRGSYRESFDLAVARAVATMDWLCEWCLPLVKKGGAFLAMKGPRHALELPEALVALRAGGGGEPRVHPVHLPEMEGHVIVEIPKIGRCDKRLPRPATLAKGRPLR